MLKFFESIETTPESYQPKVTTLKFVLVRVMTLKTNIQVSGFSPRDSLHPYAGV